MNAQGVHRVFTTLAVVCGFCTYACGAGWFVDESWWSVTGECWTDGYGESGDAGATRSAGPGQTSSQANAHAQYDQNYGTCERHGFACGGGAGYTWEYEGMDPSTCPLTITKQHQHTCSYSAETCDGDCKDHGPFEPCPNGYAEAGAHLSWDDQTEEWVLSEPWVYSPNYYQAPYPAIVKPQPWEGEYTSPDGSYHYEWYEYWRKVLPGNNYMYGDHTYTLASTYCVPAEERQSGEYQDYLMCSMMGGHCSHAYAYQDGFQSVASVSTNWACSIGGE